MASAVKIPRVHPILSAARWTTSFANRCRHYAVLALLSFFNGFLLSVGMPHFRVVQSLRAKLLRLSLWLRELPVPDVSMT